MEIRKKKKYAAAFAVLALSVLLALALFAALPFSADAQTSGSLIDYTVTPDFAITMDANGNISGSADTYNETDKAFSNDNTPTRRFRQRIFRADSFRPESGYYLYAQADICNYTGEYFQIAGGMDSVGNTAFDYITVTARKATEEKKPLRFALVFRKGSADSADTKVVTVQITITAQMLPGTTGTDLYIGRQLSDENDKINLPTDDTDFVDIPVRITNNTSKEINLEKYLVGRKLYSANPGWIEDRTDNAPDAESKALKSGENYQYFNDIDSFEIPDKPSNSLIAASDVSFYNMSDGNRSFVIDLHVTTAKLRELKEGNKDIKIWESDGGQWNFPVKLKHKDSETVYTVYIPIVVVPSEPKSNPAFKITDSVTMPTSLNAGGADTFFYDLKNPSASVTASDTGFGAVRVYPQYLCDFAAYDDSEIRFFESIVPTPSSSGIVEVSPVRDESDSVYYLVKATGNGTADVTFDIKYKMHDSDQEYQDKYVSITFKVYGKYEVRLSVSGSKTHRFTIDSGEFEELRGAKYHIAGATLRKLNSEDTKNYAAVNYSNGVISVTPYDNALDDSAVVVDVTLRDVVGHEIVLECPLRINMQVGFGANWPLWKWVLFWVGIGLAIALILLFAIWLFVRSMHKRKMDELETSAPTSAYIIKLNSTIAAAQAQQRLATQPYGGAAPSQMLQLGAGPASTPAPDPNTLALGITPQPSMPLYSTGAGVTPPPAEPLYSQPVSQTTNTSTSTTIIEEIYIPLSDEELLRRIYEEKFAPRGMLERTFNKSKDLQQRELEKEKERIREDVRNGMTIEEACKSLKQREAEKAGAAGIVSDTAESGAPTATVDPLIVLLGFDPSEPIVADVVREEPQADWGDEMRKLKEAEYNNLRLRAELNIIESRLAAVTSADEKTSADVGDASAAIERLTADIRTAEQTLDDKNADRVVARGKTAKEALDKEIAELEAKIKSDKESVAGKKVVLESNSGLLTRIKDVSEEYAGKKEATEALLSTSDGELEAARAEAQKAADLAERARKLALLNAQLDVLNPMMLTVNTLDGEIIDLNNAIEQSAHEKDSLKTRVAAIQSEMLATTDASRIGEMNEQIKALNKEISEVDRKSTANVSLKTNKNIEMSSVRRKANEYIDKEQIEYSDVVSAEDKIIGKLALDKLIMQVSDDKTKAEQAVEHWQNECDRLVNHLDSSVAETVAAGATRVAAAEEELAAAQAKLEEMTAAVEAATDDEEKLNLSMAQMAQQEEVNELTAALEAVRAESLKANLEFRTTGEGEIEMARAELERARAEFAQLSERFNEVNTGIDPLDLITSGSGVISRDRKKIEEENYKKKLEESQNAIEQARLQAQLAQEEAERAVAEAQRASDESKAEAERIAQEALERAESAREEAESKAREEAERAKLEAEEYKRQAQEEIERAKLEAEQARKAAEEDAERARKEAEEENERMRKEMEESKRQAEEEAERARLEAEEKAEQARKEAEEEAEKARLAAEEEKRKSEEEAEQARKAAEEEAQKLAEEEAKRKARIDEKVAKRKEEIAKLRDELKTITEEEQGNALREKFYQIQLSLDEDEKTSQELNDLLAKSMDDAIHAAELSRYKKLANQKPRRIVKKVTERVNHIPKSARTGRRPVRPGARPAGARPAGARPRPAGARPTGTRPRPSGARPTGTRSGGTTRRPSGTRPTTRK